MNKPEMDNQHWSMDRKQLFQGISLKCAQPSGKRKGSQKRYYNQELSYANRMRTTDRS